MLRRTAFRDMRMNVHSREPPVPDTVPQLHDDDAAKARRARILDAAERCFVRAGFHRTTMQDVAAEAAMSPGNLYRYFASKGAIVAGLTERDRAEVGEDFARLEDVEDLTEAFRGLAHHHFGTESREKTALCLEIWAESARNADFAAMSSAFECDITERLVALFRRQQASGKIPREVAPEALASLVCTYADGMMVRRAILPGFDANTEIERFVAVIEAGMAGRIPLPPVPPTPAPPTPART